MPDSIGWNFEESSSLGIVNNDNAAVARFNGSIKTFLREELWEWYHIIVVPERN